MNISNWCRDARAISHKSSALENVLGRRVVPTHTRSSIERRESLLALCEIAAATMTEADHKKLRSL
jgi:hypothetical protein